MDQETHMQSEIPEKKSNAPLIAIVVIWMVYGNGVGQQQATNQTTTSTQVTAQDRSAILQQMQQASQ